MKTKHIALLILNLLTCNFIFAQIPFDEFSEKFNSNSKPYGWENEIASGATNWQFADGSIDNTHPPFDAYEGDYNAVFLYANNSTSKTKLVTPEINFDFAIKPVLIFYLAQYLYDDDFGSGNTRLTLYFRSPEYNNNQWTFIKEYQDAIDGWQKQEVLLPDTLKYFSSVQLAFEGWSSKIFEHGTCIDDVSIIETGIIPKFLGSITAFQPSTDVIPTGSNNNPVMRLKISVKGNDGLLALDSIGINGLFDSEFVVPENGVKLFSTLTERFNDTTQIGNASSFENGVAIFDNIGYDLPIGNSYLWITYDVPIDENHEFKGKKLDASISANGIKINNEYYASIDLAPGGDDGYRLIDESLFFDNFEGENFWSLSGEFEIGIAQGLGGYRPEPDPSYARSGKKVLGTDLSGLGSYEGDYERNLGTKAYIAQADTILNAKYFKDLKLGYYRWLNLYTQDSASIDISTDNGTTWNPIWKNTGGHIESIWSFKEINLSSIMDRKEEVLFRYTLGPTDISPYSGWNIDNFAITGTFVNDDAGFLSLISPNEGCGHFGPEPLEISVKNYGYSPTNDTIEVGYSIDGGTTWIKDTIFETIPKEGSKNFTFSEPIDISAPGFHRIMVKTFYQGDEDSRNDLMDTTIFSSPNFTIPYSESFETNNGFWRNRGTMQTWEHGLPKGLVINKAASGTKAWITNLDGVYPNNDSSILESPCFDFTGIVKPIFECRLFAQGQSNTDGLALYYSIDDGASWNLIPMHAGTYNWNWYNNASISTLGTAGWDTTTPGWFKAREVLPNDIAGQSSVKFRFLFTSNDTIQNEGFGIDAIRIYEAPIDAGVSALVNPVTDCYLSKEETITVSVKNFGIRPITSNDTLFAKAIINNLTTLVDTFITPAPIAIGGTQNFTFSQTHNMFAKKWYHLKMYTQARGDTAFYFTGVYNDTLMDSVYVEGEPYYTLGPDIGTYDSDTISLDGKLQAGNGNPFTAYNWYYIQKDSTATGQTFDVPPFPTGLDFIDFAIDVVNDSACHAYDTIQIIKSQTDIGITAFSGVADACIDNQNPELQVTIKNFTSGYTMLTDSVITVGYLINDENFYTESFALTADLLPGATLDYTFTGIQPEFADSGSFNLKVFTSFNADLNYRNDTMEADYTIWPLPMVDIGPDTVFTLNADTISFDAGAGFTSYLWQDNTTSDQTFDINNDFTNFYSVKVESQFGCGFAYDTVQIIADNWVLDSLVSPVSSCAGSASQQVTIHINNNSPNAYASGTPIQAIMHFDNKKVTRTITTPVLSGNDAFNYTFDTLLNMTAEKVYNLDIKLYPDLDINKNDNELIKAIETWGIHPVNIGPDSIVTRKADTITFDAGPYYDTYAWSTGATSQTYKLQVKNSTNYSVTVTDEHACSNSSDIVKVIAYDIGVTEIVTPESQCDLTSVEKIKLTLFNYGPDILPVNENLSFFYQINNGPWIEKTHTMSVSVEPEKSTNIVLFESIPFESDQIYQMKLYSRWSKDHFFSNDTAYKTIFQYDKPTVSLGPDIFTTMPDTVVLDAGSGHTTYTWQDGSHNQTFEVSQISTSENSVMVTNSNGCFDRDTVIVYTNDIKISSIASLTNCEVGNSNTVTVYVKVNSQDTLLAGTEIDASYTFEGNTVNETLILASNLKGGDSVAYTFTTPFSVADTGNYQLTAAIAMQNEAETTNNELETQFRIGAYPVNLGPDIYTYEESVTLDAGEGFVAYLWNTGSTEQEIEVTQSGIYKVIITDVNACNSADSLKVQFLNPNYEITEIIGLADNCTHSSSENFSFILKNTGNDTIFADSTINISYSLNGQNPVNETYTFTNKLEPNTQVTIPFTTGADLSQPAAYQIWVSVVFGEIETSNDTLINTWDKPEVNLGNDIQSPNETVTLDAGEGFASYLWNTSATTQTITVNTNGDYWVEVSDANGCINSDTINVYFLPVSLKVFEFVAPIKGCGALADEEVRIVVKNTGQKVVPAGTIIGLAYKFNTDERIDETIEFANDMQANANLSYTFAQNLSTDAIGEFPIEFYVNFEDMDMDTANYTLTIYAEPVFFGGADTIRVEAYPHTLNPNVSAETYLWNTSETTPSISIASDGNYSVTITQDNNCTFEGSVYVKNITGIMDAWGKKIAIYPVPADKELWIKIPDSYGNVSVQITDALGKRCYINENAQNTLRISIEPWEQGLYFLKIFNAEYNATYQVVKH